MVEGFLVLCARDVQAWTMLLFGGYYAVISAGDGTVPTDPRSTDDSRSLRRVLAPYVKAGFGFSLAYNLLLLISPLYMLQVYDRVLTSGSIDTLLLLTGLAIVMYGIYATADAGRRRVFALLGTRLGAEMEQELFACGMTPAGSGRRLETAVADLGRVQTLFSGGAVQVVFDMPFVPLFGGLVFFVHPVLGWITVAGAVVLALLAWSAERTTNPRLEEANQREQAAGAFLSGVSRQYGVVTAMGMGPAVLSRWRGLRAAAAEAGLSAGGTAGVYGGASKSFRQMLQTLILGTAAWLVLRHEISGGAIIASSILSGRALGPIDQAIASWKPFVRARQSWRDLQEYRRAGVPASATTPLPKPDARLILDRLVVRVPGAPEALLPPLSLTLEPGQVLLLLGASGQGKSATLQTLAAAWAPGSGNVSLGGIDLHAWPSNDRGRFVGFLPQHVDLLPGTVRQNIERLSDGPDDSVFAAATAVGAHEMILSLDGRYDTPVLVNGGISAGQRQLIGLARAAYGVPPVIFLDEPSASLDQASIGQLQSYLRELREEKRIAVVSTHDYRLLPFADLVLLIEGRQPRLTSRDEFVRAMNAAGNAARQRVAS